MLFKRITILNRNNINAPARWQWHLTPFVPVSTPLECRCILLPNPGWQIINHWAGSVAVWFGAVTNSVSKMCQPSLFKANIPWIRFTHFLKTIVNCRNDSIHRTSIVLTLLKYYYCKEFAFWFKVSTILDQVTWIVL